MLGSFNGGSDETKFNIEQCIKYVLKSGKIKYSDEEFVRGFSWFSFTCSPDMVSFMIDNYSDKFLPLEKGKFSYIVRHRNIPVLKYLLENHYEIVADSISDAIKIACELIKSHSTYDSKLVNYGTRTYFGIKKLFTKNRRMSGSKLTKVTTSK